MLRDESIVYRSATATRDNSRFALIESRLFEELVKAFPASNVQFLGIGSASATFDIHKCIHQRVPPICPLVHNWPRRYLSSQTTRSSFLSRRISVLPLCFSQTTTDSGCSVIASTKMSE